jgi:small subunit ribosomal protein S16
LLRMRLRRTGAKKQPRYRVVIADARAPRDGAFVDSIGFYDPLTEPATVRIDQDRARQWLGKGVQPSDTVRRLLRSAGIVDEPEPVYAAPTRAVEPTSRRGGAAAAAAPAKADEAGAEQNEAVTAEAAPSEEPPDDVRPATE